MQAIHGNQPTTLPYARYFLFRWNFIPKFLRDYAIVLPGQIGACEPRKKFLMVIFNVFLRQQ
jgi:hypothetical protein